MVSTTLGIGLFSGFNSPVFALAVAISMIVLYDAAGVRRQAGIHAERINMIFEELWKGNPINEAELKEMLGHTPLEVLGGTLTGILTALFVWLVWPK
jgi:acid phosphatase family membrane protein YuiD